MLMCVCVCVHIHMLQMPHSLHGILDENEGIRDGKRDQNRSLASNTVHICILINSL